MVEELHDSVVGQCFTSQKFYYRLINYLIIIKGKDKWQKLN